jgi:hypothetical protein
MPFVTSASSEQGSGTKRKRAAHLTAGAAAKPLGFTHQLSFQVAPGAIDWSSA